MCDKAVSNLRQGFSIKIDWNTKTNFRTTASLFPKLMTQPVSLMRKERNTTPKKTMTNKDILEKQQHLQRMLFRRHKKIYQASKQDQQEEMMLFGEKSTRNNTSVDPKILSEKIQEVNRNKTEHKKSSFSSPKRELTMIEVQQDILSKTKLQVLREELKLKFQ